ncbi:MBL fold metallo-hydrolase [Streptomyces sp. NPDC057307]|uniref:MBL fold metallo-hydrolase n=1 Tax=Streptomyces sp. NPDC057307 TaxID=3346096 RepID=UPI003642019A
MTAGAPRTTEIADNVFAHIQPDGGWCVSNAGILLAPDRVALIDTAATESRALALRDTVDALSPEPVRLVVNTHFHGDHSFGNALVGPDAVIVAHERTRTEMADAGLGLTGLWPDVNWGKIGVTLPQLTYRRRLTLHHGDLRVELFHPGPAHTTNDTLVWLPDQRVLFAGDILLPGRTPFVLMGSVAGSLRTLEVLRRLDPLTVVGGHGPLAGPEVIDETERYLRRLQSVAAAASAAGLTPLEAAREAGPGPFEDWHEPERLVANLHRAYAELGPGPPGESLDVIGIFGDMVTYNGGRLPVCYA